MPQFDQETVARWERERFTRRVNLVFSRGHKLSPDDVVWLQDQLDKAQESIKKQEDALSSLRSWRRRIKRRLERS